MVRLSKRDFWVPASLIALSLVPVAGGVVRLAGLAGSATGADDARFLASPAPVTLHVVAATLYAVVGAFQFADGMRRRWPGWHRVAGRALVACGLVVAATGVWMTFAYPIPVELQGPLLASVRLAVGTSMAVLLVLALWSIRRRNVAAHEAWMIRAYALAQGAGTQALLFLPIFVLSGPLLGPARDALMSSAWLINLVVAEGWIRRRRSAAGNLVTARGGAR